MDAIVLTDPLLWLVVAAGAFLGGLVQSVTGFGAAVVMMILYPNLTHMGMVYAPTLVITVCVGLTLVMVWRYRRHISLRKAWMPTAIYSAVSIGLVFLIPKLNADVLLLIFSGFLILLGVFSLLRGDRPLPVPGKAFTVVWSAFSGIFSGLFSTGGPPMALYFSAVTDSVPAYLGCLQFMFLIGNATTMVTRIANGLFPAVLLPTAAAGFAFVLLGEAVGSRISRVMKQKLAQKVVYIAVALSGAVTLVQNLPLR